MPKKKHLTETHKTRDESGNIGLPNAGHTAFPSMQGIVQNAIDQQQPLPQYPDNPVVLTSHDIPGTPPPGDYHGVAGGRSGTLDGKSSAFLPQPEQQVGPEVPGAPKPGARGTD